jgi:hypothetical protein
MIDVNQFCPGSDIIASLQYRVPALEIHVPMLCTYRTRLVAAETMRPGTTETKQMLQRATFSDFQDC